MKESRAIVWCLCVAAAASCVTHERDEMRAVRDAYEQCVEEQSADAAECSALRERLHTAQERYEDNAQRAWGCNPAQQDCPTPR